ncbi:MAG: M61 family metallopeptidase [Opitutaceae bacterium]|nr:M61 family metallopeptidase [Opitutaceae bacterium]
MFRRLTLFVVAASAALAAEVAPIEYTLRFTDATSNYLDVEAVLPTEGRAEITVFMPVWTPGSYLVREYARNIVSIAAQDPAGAALALEKTTKNRWKVATGGADRVHLKYRLFAREMNVRGSWVEADFAVLKGAATFVNLADDAARSFVVRLVLPAGWATCQTPLRPTAERTVFTADSFDHLLDSPIVAGSPLVDSFEVAGVKHVLVTLGGDGVWDNARVARNLARLVEEQVKFWGGLPYREPYYFINLLGIGRGGLEHSHSTVMGADRWNSRNRSGINSWLSLASHEFFHVWNGKRLRPVGLGPFDYEHETYTHSLWVVEGVTSYYQHLLLRRAGFVTRDDYLSTVAGAFNDVQRSPARLMQSLSAASFDTWIKAYRPDENSVNAHFSYYSGGALAMLLLDAEVRRVSDGAKSLDDVMRAAYARYSGERGYTEAEFIALTSEVAGRDLADWFRRTVQNPGEWDPQPFLDWYGLALVTPPPDNKIAPNGLEPPDPPRAWLGADTRAEQGVLSVTAVRAGSPAAMAGVLAQDEILAIDDYRVAAERFTQRLGAYKPGDNVVLLVARREKLIRLPVTLGAEPPTNRRLEIRKDATAEQKARLKAWIGEDKSIALVPLIPRSEPLPPPPEPLQAPAGS